MPDPVTQLQNMKFKGSRAKFRLKKESDHTCALIVGKLPYLSVSERKNELLINISITAMGKHFYMYFERSCL